MSGGSGSAERGNSLPAVALSPPPRSTSGELELAVVLYDDDEDPVDLRIDFLPEGAGEYRPASLAEPEDALDLAADSTGVAHVIRWRYRRDLGAGANRVRVRVTPSDVGSSGSAAESSEFVVGNDSPTVSITSAATLSDVAVSGDIAFEYVLADSTDDVSELTAEFSTDGQEYHPATTSTSTTADLSPGAHSFVWSSRSDAAAARFEGDVFFRLIADDGFESGRPSSVLLLLDNNDPPAVNNLFDTVRDSVGPIVVPFRLSDAEADVSEVIVQWAIEPEGQFPNLDDPVINPYINSRDERFAGESIEDPEVRRALLADDSVRRQLAIVTEARIELRARGGVGSKADLLVAPELVGERTPEQFEGAEVFLGKDTSPRSSISSVRGSAFALSPPIPGLEPGTKVRVRISQCMGRGLRTSVDGLLHSLLWDVCADLPSAQTISVKVSPFDTQAGSPAQSFRVDHLVLGNFIETEVLDTGDATAALLIADWSQDGRGDVAVAHPEAGSLFVHTTGPRGSMRAARTISLKAGAYPSLLAKGDLDADLRADLVVGSPPDATVKIFYPGPSGLVDARNQTLVVGPDMQSLAVGDVNGDGLDDLVVSRGVGGEMAIWLQDLVTGLPSVPTWTRATSGTATVLRVADVDGDGRRDIAAALPTKMAIAVWLQALGTLPAEPSYLLPCGSEPIDLAIGTLDEDYLPDIAIAMRPETEVTVWYQASAGGFEKASADLLFAGVGSRALAIADIDRDGHQDLLAVSHENFVLDLWLGSTGRLRQEPSARLMTGAFPRALAVGDLRGDGRLSAVVASEGDAGDPIRDELSVYTGSPRGGLQAQSSMTLQGGVGGESLAIGDINGDGREDLAVVNALDILEVWLQDAGGVFSATPSLGLTTGASPGGLVIGDLDQDGFNDVALTARDRGVILVFLQHASGALGPDPDLVLTGTSLPEELAIGDLDGDGRLDLAATGALGADRVQIYLQNSAGVLASSPSASLVTGSRPGPVDIRDLNGDGRGDLLVLEPGDRSLSLWLQSEDGSLPRTATKTIATDGFPGALSVGDYDGNGLEDLAVLDLDGGEVVIFLNDAASGIETVPSLRLKSGRGSEWLSTGDLDGDGRTDLAVTNLDAATITVWLQEDEGLREVPHQVLEVGRFPGATAVGDLNGDGRDDLAVADAGESGVPADDVIHIFYQQ